MERGFYRSAVFFGLGVNSAESDTLTEFHLSKYTNLRLVPPEVSPATLNDWKNELRTWVIMSGFCEMVDCLCISLNQIYTAASIAGREYSPEKIEAFEGRGLPGKLRDLEKDYGIRGWDSEKVASFGGIRNCFIHRKGRVGKADLRSKEVISIHYIRFNSFCSTKDGEFPIDVFDPNSPTFTVPEGGAKLALRINEAEKSFKGGDVIGFSPKELAEIMFFARYSSRVLLGSLFDFIKSKGIRIVETGNHSD